ncbi:MAG: carboxypeptidase regulatory-like domain-containing protein [Bryobacteraceae bacterium]|nr:carboxypeptidase regulatory-like domain-containing protein [Bryobacteraceae bacterium]
MKLLPVLLWIAITASGQTSSGTITGAVQDSSGAMIPGAEIRIIGSETGDLVRTLTTGDSGSFASPLLRPGIYNIEVSFQGFKKLVRQGITLRVDEVLDLRFALEPGGATEQITVTAEAPQLEEKTHSVGQVVDSRTILQLPLNGRNYLQLGNLTAGTVPNVRSRDKTFSAYGNRGLQNAFLLDGARNQNYLRGLDNRQRDAMRPSLEAIAEFKVQTANFSAEYGASAGAVVNVVTKGGTNDIHGSAFEFLRNSAFDATDFFQPAGRAQPLFIQHQFGGSAGGPVKRNRAWWFGAFERTHISEETTSTATVPQLAERGGQFGARGVFDPLTTRANPNGSGFIRDRFANNVIPASRFDRIGKAQIDKYPVPLTNTAARNYVTNPLEATRINNGTFRGDVRVSDRDTLFQRFSFVGGDFVRPAPLPAPAGNGTLRDQPSWSVGLGHTRVITPTIVHELRFAWNRVSVIQDGVLARDEVVAGALDPGVSSGTPTFGVAGFTGIGVESPNFGNLPLNKSSAVWNLSSNLSIVRSRHSMKLGFDYQIVRVTTDTTLQGRGNFAFSGVFSQDPLDRARTGSPVADLLLGFPNTITVGTRGISNERAQHYFGYFQDDYTVTPNLTLNLGIRYDLTRPFVERDNRFGNFILDDGDANYGRMVFAGNPAYPRGLQYADRNNFAPRFGFAWKTPASGLVVRGGYGIFYSQDEGTGVNRRMTNNPPFVGFGGYTIVSDQLNVSSTIPLTGALPARQPAPTPEQFRLDPRATATLVSWDQRFRTGYVQQWIMSLQKQLPGNTLLEVNYVGNHGIGLGASYPANNPQPGPGAVADRRPLAPGFTRAPVFRASPWATSNYHGVSTRFEKRFSRGLSYLASFTFGRAIDTASEFAVCDACGASGDDSVPNALDRRGFQRGLSNHHVGRRFVFSGNWELPFGSGRAFANQGTAKHVLGGWALSGIFTAADGIPFTPSLSFDNANTGGPNRPNRLRDGQLENRTIQRYFDIDAFAFPAQFTYGNSGRNVLIGPGSNSVDFVVHRNFRLPVNEVSELQFRVEAFNAFNRTHFDLPGSAIGTPAAGVIGATSNPNRQLQLGLKFIF